MFYEIFKYLENNVPDDLLPHNFHRQEAFEEDLAYYFGWDWQSHYTVRPSVQKYIDHLDYIKEINPLLLIAYVYHLYMGLLSGGQILHKKRHLFNKLNPMGSDDEYSVSGCSVTTFDGATIAELKSQMRNLVDEKAKEFTDELRAQILDESRRVFELNNEIVRTVRGVTRANLQKVGLAIAMSFLLYYAYRWFRS